MHIPTHILSGWCAANCLPLNPRQRLCSMIAATVADVDGIGIFISREAYWDYHHKLGHNVFFAVVVSVLLAVWSAPRRMREMLMCFGLYLGLTHLHLVLDYFGSGVGWPIYYLWPISLWQIKNPGAWEFFSWQNILALLVLLAWTILIARMKKRTPFELLAPSIENRLFSIRNPQSTIENPHVS